jgi:ribonuclease D
VTSEPHAVAAKVIATIAMSSSKSPPTTAEVQALHGWRRELLGEKAQALKQGKLPPQ